MKKRMIIAISLIALLLMAAMTLNQTSVYEIPWWAPGGGGNSQGGTYALNGVIGQPEGTGSAGGDFSLTGDFLGIKLSPQNKLFLPLIESQ